MWNERLLAVCLFFLPWMGQSVFTQVGINEFMALNTNSIPDPDFLKYSDWIELYNMNETDFDVSGYFLTDDLLVPEKWAIPEGTIIEPGGYLVIWADGHNTGLHTSFRLGGSGEQIGIFGPGKNVIDTITYGPQQSDISFGKDISSGKWVYFLQPTPGESNSGTVHIGISGEPLFDSPGGFYNSTVSLDITSSDPGAVIRFTTDGTAPDSLSPEYTASLSISGNMTIRARIYQQDKLPGKVVNHSYFINEPDHDLPVISISTKPEFLWDSEEGIYENYQEEWEKPCGLEYFDSDGKQVININAGMKIFGGTSRGRPQKSLSIHTRNVYGDGAINYHLLPGRETGIYKSFILRNSANDWSGNWRGTMFRDALIHSIVENQMDLDYQSYQPVVIYLNGVYWGIQNLRDKHNEDYCEILYGVDGDSVDIIKHNEVIAGDGVLYNEMMNFLENHNLDDNENYKIAASMIDIDEFINYMITEIYSCNIDWPANNYRLWRATSPNGKWRWMLFDTEFGFNGFQWAPPSSNMFNKALDPDIDDYVNQGLKAPWATLAFIKLTQNEEFRNKFVSMYLSQMYTTYRPGRVVGIVDKLAGNLESEMPRHIARWGSQGGIYSLDLWHQNIQGMKDFAWDRPQFALNHLKETFAIEDKNRVNLEITADEGGNVELNGIPIDQPHFANDYFLGLPVSLNIRLHPGFDFKGWLIQDSSQNKIQLIETGNPWNYIDDGSDQGSGWIYPDFNDASWKTGNSKFGFGDGNEETMVSFGGDTDNKYVTYYFRTEFLVEGAESFINLDMNLLRDDGAVVYLNGIEIRRSNMTSRELDFKTLALTEVMGENESAYVGYSIDPELLLEGRNVVAVEVHQASVTSSDLGFDLNLTGTSTRAVDPVLLSTESLDWVLQGDVKISALIEPSGELPTLRINEIVAGNSNGMEDEYGDTDDWIEIYNQGHEIVDLGGLYITDSLPDPYMWEIPGDNPEATTVDPGEFVIVWADNEPEEGALHVGFKLSKSGEQIGLFKAVDDTMILLDSITFSAIPSDVSMARVPDGEGPWELFSNPTPMDYNFYLGEKVQMDAFSDINLYPNPSTGWIRITGLQNNPESSGQVAEVSIINDFGQVVHQELHPADEVIEVNLTTLTAGLYLVRIAKGDHYYSRRVVLLK